MNGYVKIGKVQSDSLTVRFDHDERFFGSHVEFNQLNVDGGGQWRRSEGISNNIPDDEAEAEESIFF